MTHGTAWLPRREKCSLVFPNERRATPDGRVLGANPKGRVSVNKALGNPQVFVRLQA